jgi:hypothetical protein
MFLPIGANLTQRIRIVRAGVKERNHTPSVAITAPTRWRVTAVSPNNCLLTIRATNTPTSCARLERPLRRFGHRVPAVIIIDDHDTPAEWMANHALAVQRPRG